MYVLVWYKATQLLKRRHFDLKVIARLLDLSEVCNVLALRQARGDLTHFHQIFAENAQG